jgi:hypothetical protein
VFLLCEEIAQHTLRDASANALTPGFALPSIERQFDS